MLNVFRCFVLLVNLNQHAATDRQKNVKEVSRIVKYYALTCYLQAIAWERPKKAM